MKAHSDAAAKDRRNQPARALLKRVSLDEDGIAFLGNKLKNTGLSSKLLGLPLREGLCYSVVPQSASMERAKQFDTGGLMNMSESQNWLTKHVLALASEKQTGTIIFQDVWGGRPGDSGITKRKSKLLFNGSDLYHFVEASNANADSVLTAMREVASFLVVGAFVDFPVVPTELPTDRFVDDGFIDELAKNAQEIYVSAYDQEGIVVWQRK